MKALLPLLLLACSMPAQVYSPSVLLRNQPDATSLKSLAESVIRKAGARTPQAKAQAIWRFFLTDGRFVEPGFWYHIAGWAYEEPTGEVLDPIKLLNSYGFGLCYHLAPLLEAVFEAAGFEDARVWFLTGHTVAEVRYDGTWHYFDSDMMGYNVAGDGHFQGKAVASVRDLEQNPEIILGKMQAVKSVKQGVVDDPWYPADVRAGAMKGLADLFTSTHDNYVFPFTRYSVGHDMSYVVRPGEKIIRFFEPEEPSLYYLPYAFNGTEWQEFPKEIKRYGITTENGPRSEKDKRLWGTGRIEYTPPSISDRGELRYFMPSPWVIIDARFSASVELRSPESWLSLETSTDGISWGSAGKLIGPYKGQWNVEPNVIRSSEHGRLTAVSGTYGYHVRIRRSDPGAKLDRLTLTSRFQHNPRTLPALSAGNNELVYRSGPAQVRESVPVELHTAAAPGLPLVSEAGQGMLCPAGKSAETIVQLPAGTGFDFGARFLAIKSNLAPDKLTAETRTTRVGDRSGAASIEWSAIASGPWRNAWKFPSEAAVNEGEQIDRVLAWPEAFISVRDLPADTKSVYVRLRTSGPCIDSLRAAVWRNGSSPSGKLRITHVWEENGSPREHTEAISATSQAREYRVRTAAPPRNVSVTFEALP